MRRALRAYAGRDRRLLPEPAVSVLRGGLPPYPTHDIRLPSHPRQSSPESGNERGFDLPRYPPQPHSTRPCKLSAASIVERLNLAPGPPKISLAFELRGTREYEFVKIVG